MEEPVEETMDLAALQAYMGRELVLPAVYKKKDLVST